MPTLSHSPLDSRQQEQARALWDALMHAPSRAALEAARQQLRDTEPPVRYAVMEEIALVWRQGQYAESDRNPFG